MKYLFLALLLLTMIPNAKIRDLNLVSFNMQFSILTSDLKISYFGMINS